jgi:hypothetical protein
MATTDNLIRLKRSAVQGKAPTVTDIDFGELAINTYDGYIYLKRDGAAGEEIARFRDEPTFTVIGRTQNTIIEVS